MGLMGFFRKKNLTAKPAFVEKRLLPRWKISAPARIKWQGCGDYISCEVIDLNMKGFCLAIREEIPEAISSVELYFNEKYFFEVGISIIWHKEINAKQVYGVRLLRVRDSDREKIFLMMKENFAGRLRNI